MNSVQRQELIAKRDRALRNANSPRHTPINREFFAHLAAALTKRLETEDK